MYSIQHTNVVTTYGYGDYKFVICARILRREEKEPPQANPVYFSYILKM